MGKNGSTWLHQCGNAEYEKPPKSVRSMYIKLCIQPIDAASGTPRLL